MNKDRGRSPVSLLITDFDNTLYDWFAVWYASFGALLRVLTEQSGIPQPVLESEIREVHRRRGTSEYSYLLNEIPALRALHPNKDISEVYREAIIQYRVARKEKSSLYHGVAKTLRLAKRAGLPIVVYTESLAFYSAARVRRLGLDDVVDCLYSPPDHDFPKGVTPEALRTMSSEFYRLKHTAHCHTPRGTLKPDPEILASIVARFGIPAERVLYVGDSLMKDVAMAQSVGVIDVYAKYGAVNDKPEYDLLRRVSHWTERDVQRERRISESGSVVASYTLDRSFDQLLNFFRFEKG